MVILRKRTIFFVAIPFLIFSIFMMLRSFEVEVDQQFVMEPEKEQEVEDLESILDRGVLQAATDYNSTNYFVYRGEPMGFHLELLQHFAAHLGVDLEVVVSNDLHENIDRVVSDDGTDLLAQSLTVTNERRETLTFTEPYDQTRQVLVQRKPSRHYNMHSSEIEEQLVRDQIDLAGKTVHVQQNSVFVSRLNNLMDEIGDSIYVVEREETMEELIELVAEGEIEYTVADEKLARLNEMYYANIDTGTPVSFKQHLAWAVRPGADKLLDTLNHWLNDFKSTRQYTEIYNQYYHNPRSVFIAKSDLHSLGGGKISEFDDHFRRYAGIVGWDWRLIASLSYQESRFNPSAVSWAGAFGIMQLMPGTADFLDVGVEASAREHIAAGVRYLQWLNTRLAEEIPDDDKRVKFVLASYNVGIGHVLDARRLARKYGKDPDIWKDNVDYFVLNKSKPEYYRDPVVRYGYARGSEPYNYVTEILDRYQHYKNALGEQSH